MKRGVFIQLKQYLLIVLFSSPQHHGIITQFDFFIIFVPIQHQAAANTTYHGANSDFLKLQIQVFQQFRRAARFGAAAIEDNMQKDPGQVGCHLKYFQSVFNGAVR